MDWPFEVDAELCKGCGLCIDACPQKCIHIGEQSNSKGYRIAEPFGEEECTSCGSCAVMCPEAAITIYATADEAAA